MKTTTRIASVLCAIAATTTLSATAATAAPEAGCAGVAHTVSPNGAAAYCTSGAGYITVKLNCHVAGWETYMRYGPRVWSNAQDPSSAVSKIYCDSIWHDLKEYGFDVG